MIRWPPIVFAAMTAAACALPFVTHAPNRLVSGAPLMAWSLPHALVLLAPPLCLMISALRPPSLSGVAAAALASGAVLGFAGHAARTLSAGQPPAARTELGAGAWIMLIVLVLATIDAAHRAARPRSAGIALSAVLAALLASGALESLGVMREYAVRHAAFWSSFARHLTIVASAVSPALLLGLPLGLLAVRRGKILTVLGLIQTVPSLALFGLLIPLLSALGAPGVGLLPAAIALSAYALLPVAAATAAGFSSVPAAVRDAAAGIGLSPREVFWTVDVPLARPTILAGIRVTVVQAIGLATIAALVGAGGLGSLVFDGLFANALDLVLLGTLPIVALALAADAALAAAA